MGISETVAKAYYSVEEGFFKIMDFLEQKGVPVYGVINPIEEKGVPFFPLVIASLILVAALGYGFLFIGFTTEVTFELVLKDGLGNRLDDVSVRAYDSAGNRINLNNEEIFDSGQEITMTVPRDVEITFRASKEDYGDAEYKVTARSESADVKLILGTDKKEITGIIRFTDAVSGEVITGISGSLDWYTDIEHTRACYEAEDYDSGGVNLGTVLVCNSVPVGIEMELSVSADDYEQEKLGVVFREGEVVEKILEPKAVALQGKANLVIRIIDSEGQQVENANIKIYKAETNELLADVTDEDGAYVQTLERSKEVRVVVTKNGFVQYDSNAEGILLSMRAEEESLTVPLIRGGMDIRVTVNDAGTLSLLSKATVMLYNKDAELLDTAETQFGGYVEFKDLNSVGSYYVTAIQKGYLPSREKFTPVENSDLQLSVSKENSGNSAKLDLHVRDFTGLLSSNAAVRLYEIDGLEKLPLGVPVGYTGLAGKFSHIVPMNRKILAVAKKGAQRGEAEVEFTASGAHTVELFMGKKEGFVLVRLLTEEGSTIVDGSVLVETSAGGLLLDTEVEDGEVFFDAMGHKRLRFVYLSPEGLAYTEEINVEGKEFINIKISEEELTKPAPEINFLGVFDASGDYVEGVEKGKDYYLKFETLWPKGNYTGGVHVRVGPDFIKHVNEQEVGILGFDALATDFHYGRTYTMLPEPGFEGIDFQNTGKAGEHNKWLELYFKGEQAGTKIIKVRVNVKENTVLEAFELHYRAWAEIAGKVHRAPEDTVLGELPFVEARSGLYAETNTETIGIFDEQPLCRNELCVSYKFIRADGTEFSTEDFWAAKGERYALEVEARPKNNLKLNSIRAATSRTNPKIGFIGYAVDSEGEFPDSNSSDTGLQVDDIEIASGETTKARLYFKARELGDTFITAQVIAPLSTVNDRFNFSVHVEKKLIVTTSPDAISAGEDFSIKVADEDNKDVEDATIRIYSEEGELLRTIIGDGTENNGLGGYYKVDNTFEPGLLSFEVNSEKKTPFKGGFEVQRKGVLLLPDEVVMNIPAGQKKVQQEVLLENAKEHLVNSISVEVKPVGIEPLDMAVEANVPATLAGGSRQRILVLGAYDGEEETEHGEYELTVNGLLFGKYKVSAKTRVKLTYNRQLEENCLEFSKPEIKIPLVGNSGSRYQDQYYHDKFSEAAGYNNYYPAGYYPTGGDASADIYPVERSGNLAGSYQNKYGYNYSMQDRGLGYGYGAATGYRNQYTNSRAEVKLTVKNNCDAEINLTPTVIPLEDNEEDLRVEVPSVSLGPKGSEKDSREITVSVTNTLYRVYPDRETFDYDIQFESPAITKSIPLEVLIWNASYALQMNRNLEVWLTAADTQGNIAGIQQGQAAVTIPLLIRNIGEADIENLRFFTEATGSSNVRAEVYPRTPVPVLRKGQVLNPAPLLTVTALRDAKTTLYEKSYINVLGNIGGKQYDFGPVAVHSHISSAECLQVLQSSSVEFTSTKSGGGGLTKTVTVRNNCAEAVRITAIEPATLGATNNRIGLVYPVELAPATEAKVNLLFTKNEDTQHTGNAYFRALLVNSGKWIKSTRFGITAKIGKFSEEKGAAATGYELKVCGTDETKKVDFPQLGSSCDTAYCDAEQAANYIAARIADRVGQAENAVKSYKSSLGKSNCSDKHAAQGYCLFDRLGVETGSFYMYMMNDNLSPELLKDVLEKKYQDRLGSYRVDFIGSAQEFEDRTGGSPNTIQFAGNMQGCGRYRVRITGSVAVDGYNLIPDSSSVLVDLSPGDFEEELGVGSGAERTAQCENKIQNILNMLPVDGSYTKENRKDTWLGIVVSDEDEMYSLGGKFASSLFGDKERFVPGTSIISTNKLVVRTGNTEDHVVKIEMEKSGDKTQRRVVATIKESSNPEIQEEIAREAGKAIADLKTHKVEGCISENEDYFLIKTTREVGDIVITPCEEPLRVFRNDNGCADNGDNCVVSCCTYTITGQLEESVVPGIRPEGDTLGVLEFFVKSDGDRLESGEAVRLEQENFKNKEGESRQAYRTELEACVVGNERFWEAHDTAALLSAHAEKDELKKADEKEVLLKVCGAHPEEAVAELKKINPDDDEQGGERYFVPLWGDADDEDSGVRLDLIQKASLGGGNEIVEGVNWCQVGGAGTYFGGCMAGAALIAALIPGPGIAVALKSAAFDCLLPSIWLGLEAVEGAPIIGDYVKGFRDNVDSAIETIGKVITFLPSKAWDGIKAGINYITEQDASDPTALPETYNELMGAGAAGTFGVEALAAAYPSTITSTNYKSAAGVIADQLADGFMREKVGASISSRPAEELRDSVKDAIEKKLVEELETKHLPTRKKLVFRDTAKYKDVIDDLSKSARTAVLESDDVFDNLIDFSGDSSFTGTELEKSMKKFRGAHLETALSDDVLTKAMKGSIPSAGMEVPVGSTTTQIKAKMIQSARNAIANKVESELGIRLANAEKRALFREIVPELQGSLAERTVVHRGGVVTTVIDAPTDEALESAAKKARAVLKSTVENSKKVAAGIKNGIRSEIMDSMYNDAEDALKKKGKLKPPSRLSRAGSLFKSLGKGLLFGAAANAAGLAAYSKYMELRDCSEGSTPETTHTGKKADEGDSDNDGKVAEELCDGVDNDNDGRIDEDCSDREVPNMPLKKGHLYKATVKNTDSGREIIYEEVKNTESIQKEKEKWIEECDGSPLQKSLSNKLIKIIKNSQ